MIANQRHLFDIPEGVTYFNSAARSPLLRASIAAGEAGITRKAQPWAVDPRTVPDEAALGSSAGFTRCRRGG